MSKVVEFFGVSTHGCEATAEKRLAGLDNESKTL